MDIEARSLSYSHWHLASRGQAQADSQVASMESETPEHAVSKEPTSLEGVNYSKHSFLAEPACLSLHLGAMPEVPPLAYSSRTNLLVGRTALRPLVVIFCPLWLRPHFDIVPRMLGRGCHLLARRIG